MLNSTEQKKIIILINVKMTTKVGILTFISRINTTFGSFIARNYLNFTAFLLGKAAEIGNFMFNLVEHEISFITSGPDLMVC